MASTESSNALGRPADRRNEIVGFIRGKIVAGKLKPLQRLPVRRNLQEKFKSSMTTVQQAIDRLAEDGFVESKMGGGTYVAAKPPHLSRYAVVVSSARLDEKVSLFWRTLADSFKAFGASSGASFKFHFWPVEKASTPDTRYLVENVSFRAFAGLVFMNPPLAHEEEKRKLLNCGKIPCVAIAPREMAGKYKAAVVSLDGLAFMRMAVEHFISEGRRKIAVVTNPRGEEWWNDFHGILLEKGAETRPYWNIYAGADTRGNVRNMTNLLMQLPRHKQPDGLLVADDNLAELALAGLMDSGSDSVRGLKILSHCNYPCSFQSPLTLKLLGYDTRHVVEACMRSLARQRNGEETAGLCEQISPVFSDLDV